MILNKNEKITLLIKGDKAGDSVVLSVSANGEAVLTVKREENVLGTITLKGSNGDKLPTYIKLESENSYIQTTDYMQDYKNISVSCLIDKAGAKKGQKIKASILNEHIEGSAKADAIYTNYGRDIVIANKGNDEIHLNGEGEKTIIINKGDGNDTLVPSNFTKNYKTNVIFSSGGIQDFTYERQGTDFKVVANYKLLIF